MAMSVEAQKKMAIAMAQGHVAVIKAIEKKEQEESRSVLSRFLNGPADPAAPEGNVSPMILIGGGLAVILVILLVMKSFS